MEFKNISEIYAVIECYEMGSLDQTTYLQAAAALLKLFEKKYTKEDWRYRELFAHMQGDSWESTFEVRVLAHMEQIGCLHSSLAECDKHKMVYEKEPPFDKEPCQHCRMFVLHKEEWEKK
jgi:hypothetical protein